MTAFFIPGGTSAGQAEKAYERIREEARAYAGHSPQPVRIFSLSFRHGGADIEAEVGKPDPVGGQMVLAILDLGRGSPYLIHSRSGTAPPAQLLVDKPVYSVTEFGA